MVRRVVTYYCEACGTAYDTREDALSCEQSAQSALTPGDVILRSARGGQGFELVSGGLVWGTVQSVRSEPGRKGAPFHQVFYQTSGLHKEISQRSLAMVRHGGLSMEAGITEGPGHTRQLTYLMETFPEVREGMAECFALLSRCAAIEELTPEAYAKWDDLRYTAYDFGIVDGDAPVIVPPALLPLLRWCADKRPAEAVHQTLFWRPELGLHGGNQVYAPFDDNVGARAKWLIGQGDPYRYLRFHMQTEQAQLAEIEGLQAQVLRGDPVWLDQLEALFAPAEHPQGLVPKGMDRVGIPFVEEEDSAGLAKRVWHWMCREQEGWRQNVAVENTIIPNEIPVLAVAAGKGGVGKSTVAAQLARSAVRQGLRPLFLDLDFYGPSAPTEFGVHEPLRIEQGYIQPHHTEGVRVVSIGNMIDQDTALHWRGPVLEAFIHLLTAHIQYDSVDVILLDCPPGTGDVQLGMLNRIRPRATVLVTTASELALADVRRAAASFHAAGTQVYGVIENMSAVRLADGTEKRLFGSPDRVKAFCESSDLAYLGQIPFVDTVDEFAEIADGLAAPLFRMLSRN